MKTALALIFWTILGAISLAAAYKGLPIGWIGIVIAIFGIKQALWPSKDRAKSKSSSNMNAGGCGGDGCGGDGCGGDGCGGCGD
jgi:hypothetical protein